MVILAGMSSLAPAQEDANGELSAIEVMREVQLDAATKPLKELEAKYRDALTKKQSSAQESGNLDNVLAIKKEIEILDDGDDSASPPANPELAKLRQIYREQKAKLAPQVKTAVAAVDREYVKQLNKLIVDQTKAGNTEMAVKVKEQLDAHAKDQTSANATAAAMKPRVAESGHNDKSKGTERELKKLLTSSPWTWHPGTPDKQALATIQFTEDGKISGIYWLTGWETVNGSTFKVFQMNNPSRYWLFKLSDDRKMAESQQSGTINDIKTLKLVETRK